MSEQTWKEEFMPVPASHATESETEAIAHCLQKWRGLRKENMLRHEFDKPPLGSNNCALCLRHTHIDNCDSCPLALSRDGVACDDAIEDVEDRAPYLAYANPLTGKQPDPEPMIAALEKAARFVKEEGLE